MASVQGMLCQAIQLLPVISNLQSVSSLLAVTKVNSWSLVIATKLAQAFQKLPENAGHATLLSTSLGVFHIACQSYKLAYSACMRQIVLAFQKLTENSGHVTSYNVLKRLPHSLPQHAFMRQNEQFWPSRNSPRTLVMQVLTMSLNVFHIACHNVSLISWCTLHACDKINSFHHYWLALLYNIIFPIQALHLRTSCILSSTMIIVQNSHHNSTVNLIIWQLSQSSASYVYHYQICCARHPL